MKSPIIFLALLIIVSCSTPHGQPTDLRVPTNAQEAVNVILTEGRYFQTHFYLEEDYPSNSAFSHYSSLLGGPWHYCERGDGWFHYIDTTREEDLLIHKQIHSWLNPVEQRYISLSLTYESATVTDALPDTSSQRVILVESIGANLRRVIDRLKLECSSDLYAAL